MEAANYNESYEGLSIHVVFAYEYAYLHKDCKLIDSSF